MSLPSFLLSLYPRAWRERYGDELLSLMETRSAGPRVIVDLLRGALRERARTSPAVVAKVLATCVYFVLVSAGTLAVMNLLFRVFAIEAGWLSLVPWDPGPLGLLANIVAIGSPLIVTLPIADRYGPVAGTTIRNALWISWIATIVATPIAMWAFPVHFPTPSLIPFFPTDPRGTPVALLASGSTVIWLQKLGIEPPFRRRREYGPKPPILGLR